MIGNDAPDAFCAGANLFALMMALGQGNMQVIDQMVVDFQNACHAHPLRARPGGRARRSA